MTWFAVLALVWLVVAALALQARQWGSVRLTRRWTTRLCAVTLVPVTALAVGAALVAVQLAFAQVGTEGAVAAATPYAQWLALAINVVIVDMVLRRRDLSGEHSRRQPRVRRERPRTKTSIPAKHRAPLPRPVPTGPVTRTRTQPGGTQVHEAFTFATSPSTRA